MIQIENYREQPPAAKVIAIFDLYLPKIQLRFRNLKLMPGKHGTWIAYPSFKGEGDMWSTYWEWSLEKKKELEDQIRKEIQPFLRK